MVYFMQSGYGDYGVLGNGNNNDTNTSIQTSLQTPAAKYNIKWCNLLFT